MVQVIARNAKLEPIGVGSGFFVSADGLLVTNHHVIESAHSATVRLESNAQFPVQGIAALNEDADLALLKVNGDELDYLNLTDKLPDVGANVYAIGTPVTKGGVYKNTLSKGIVSGHAPYYQGGFDVIQTTAAIDNGSSGGPLLNGSGDVVGITTYKDEGGESLNFAIPSAKAQQLRKDAGDLTRLASAGAERIEADVARKLDAARQAAVDHEWGEAAALLKNLKESESDNPEFWRVYGIVAAEAWRTTKHSKLAKLEMKAGRKGRSLTRDRAWPYIRMGEAYLHMAEGEDFVGTTKNKALEMYKKAIRRDRQAAHAYSGMAVIYWYHDWHPGRFAHAAWALEQAKKYSAGSARSRFDRWLNIIYKNVDIGARWPASVAPQRKGEGDREYKRRLRSAQQEIYFSGRKDGETFQHFQQRMRQKAERRRNRYFAERRQ